MKLGRRGSPAPPGGPRTCQGPSRPGGTRHPGDPLALAAVMFSSRSCLEVRVHLQLQQTRGAAEGAAHAQRAQPHSLPTPAGTPARPPPARSPLTWEMPDSNSSGFSPLGLDDLGAGAEHGRDLKHRALRG